MQIEYDDELNEHYLKFLDIDDRLKKSRFLKRMLEAGNTVVTMTIMEDEKKATQSQVNLYKAFLILLKDYTGYSMGEIKDSICSHMKISKEDIANYNKQEFSEFLDRMFMFCSENVGIEVQMIDGKLTNMTEKV